MARRVALCMKSMVSTTALGPGAGVVVLCRFPVTLSTPCCYKVAAKTRRRPHPPPSPCRRLPSRSPACTADWRAGNGAIAPGQKPAQHDNLGPDGEACRAMHEEHASHDRARVWRRCCRVMQVSRDAVATKSPVWAREHVDHVLRRPADALTRPLPQRRLRGRALARCGRESKALARAPVRRIGRHQRLSPRVRLPSRPEWAPRSGFFGRLLPSAC
jgi:hypothetical protein